MKDLKERIAEMIQEEVNAELNKIFSILSHEFDPRIKEFGESYIDYKSKFKVSPNSNMDKQIIQYFAERVNIDKDGNQSFTLGYSKYNPNESIENVKRIIEKKQKSKL